MGSTDVAPGRQCAITALAPWPRCRQTSPARSADRQGSDLAVATACSRERPRSNSTPPFVRLPWRSTFWKGHAFSDGGEHQQDHVRDREHPERPRDLHFARPPREPRDLERRTPRAPLDHVAKLARRAMGVLTRRVVLERSAEDRHRAAHEPVCTKLSRSMTNAGDGPPDPSVSSRWQPGSQRLPRPMEPLDEGRDRLCDDAISLGRPMDVDRVVEQSVGAECRRCGLQGGRQIEEL